MLSNLLSSLAGSRTYLVGLSGIATSIGGYLTDSISQGESAQLMVTSAGLLALRAALTTYHDLIQSALAQYMGPVFSMLVESIAERVVNNAIAARGLDKAGAPAPVAISAPAPAPTPAATPTTPAPFIAPFVPTHLDPAPVQTAAPASNPFAPVPFDHAMSGITGLIDPALASVKPIAPKPVVVDSAPALALAPAPAPASAPTSAPAHKATVVIRLDRDPHITDGKEGDIALNMLSGVFFVKKNGHWSDAFASLIHNQA